MGREQPFLLSLFLFLIYIITHLEFHRTHNNQNATNNRNKQQYVDQMKPARGESKVNLPLGDADKKEDNNVDDLEKPKSDLKNVILINFYFFACKILIQIIT